MRPVSAPLVGQSPQPDPRSGSIDQVREDIIGPGSSPFAERVGRGGRDVAATDSMQLCLIPVPRGADRPDPPPVVDGRIHAKISPAGKSWVPWYRGIGNIGRRHRGNGVRGPGGVAEEGVSVRDNARNLAGRQASAGSDVPKIRDLECFLWEGSNGLRSASTGRGGRLRRGVDRNHSMVRDIAGPLSFAGPPPHKISRNSDTVEGGAGPLDPTGGLRQRKEGGTDSSHPVVELAAQQALLVIAGSEKIKIEVPGNEDRGRERSEREKGSEDFWPGSKTEINDQNNKIDVDGVDATVDALYTDRHKNRGSETRDARRQENSGASLGSAVGARRAGAAMTVAIGKTPPQRAAQPETQ